MRPRQNGPGARARARRNGTRLYMGCAAGRIARLCFRHAQRNLEARPGFVPAGLKPGPIQTVRGRGLSNPVTRNGVLNETTVSRCSLRGGAFSNRLDSARAMVQPIYGAEECYG